MSEDKINKSESDLLSAAIARIISSEVLEYTMSDQLPLTDDLPDSNKIFHGKASILFVDMRESTKLPDKFSRDQLVKIYRSYIRVVVQAIRYSGGVVTQLPPKLTHTDFFVRISLILKQRERKIRCIRHFDNNIELFAKIL